MEENIEVIEEEDEQEITIENEPVIVGTFPTGTININNNGEIDVTNYETANIDVHIPPNLQNKSLNISSNGEYSLEADENYDGLGTVSLSVQITDFPKTVLPNGIRFRNSTMTDVSFLSYCDTSNLTTMQDFFNYCENITSADLKGLNVSNVTDMRYAFQYCSKLVSLDLGDWNTSSLTNFTQTFSGCYRLVNLNLDSWNLNKVTSYFNGTFENCSSLSNESLNSILKALSTNTRTFSNKTLAKVGISSAQASICTNLSNWQNCVSAGWTTGY